MLNNNTIEKNKENLLKELISIKLIYDNSNEYILTEGFMNHISYLLTLSDSENSKILNDLFSINQLGEKYSKEMYLIVIDMINKLQTT